MAAKKTPVAGEAPKPRKRRWYRQLWDVYQMTRRHDPKITLWMVLASVGVLAVAVVVGLLLDAALWYVLLLAIPTAALVGLIILGRRAERAAYTQIEGQPGAAAAALGTLRRGWNVENEPVAVDPRTQDMVFRVVGRPGVFLVSEGPPARVGRLLEAERRKVTRVLPNVPVHLVQLGTAEGQVPLTKLTRALQKTKGKLTPSETAEISKRLRALGTGRPPIPRGVDPLRARPDRKGMRGR